jgi:hypothetical protein
VKVFFFPCSPDAEFADPAGVELGAISGIFSFWSCEHRVFGETGKFDSAGFFVFFVGKFCFCGKLSRYILKRAAAAGMRSCFLRQLCVLFWSYWLSGVVY